jgi:hypothetical protein
LLWLITLRIAVIQVGLTIPYFGAIL